MIGVGVYGREVIGHRIIDSSEITDFTGTIDIVLIAEGGGRKFRRVRHRN